MYLPIKIRCTSLLVNLLLITACATKSDVSTPTNSALKAQLDSLGQAIFQKREVVGFSIAMLQGEDTVYANSFGYMDAEKTKPVTVDTRFKLASVSKLVGATVVMKLAEEGKLSVDQNLAELLPDFPNLEQAEKITLAHLISHTSGLAEYATVIDSMFMQTGKAPDKEDFYSFFRERELLFEPCTNYSYCNSGFVLMAMIVERITGRTLQQEFDRIINEPSGMDLRLIEEADTMTLMSRYWERKDTSFIPYPHWTWIKGDGGLTATPLMLARFPRLWASGKIIQPASFEEMIAPRVLNDGIATGYGLGVRNGSLFGESLIGHTGGHKSTYAAMAYFPERDLTIVVFTNTDNTPTSARSIFGSYAVEYLGYSPTMYSGQAQPIAQPQNYVGDYRAFDEKIDKVIRIQSNDAGGLEYCMNDACFTMTYLGDHRFWIEDWPLDHIIFEVNEAGEALAIKEYYTGFYTVLRKRF